MLKWIRPALDMAYKAVMEFLKYWRDSRWQRQLVLLPVVVLCLLYVGFYVFFFGCRR